MDRIKIIKDPGLETNTRVALEKLNSTNQEILTIGQTSLSRYKDEFIHPVNVMIKRDDSKFNIHSPTGYHISIKPNAQIEEVLPILQRIIDLGFNRPLIRLGANFLPFAGDTYEDLVDGERGVYVKAIVKDKDLSSEVRIENPDLVRWVTDIKKNPIKWVVSMITSS